MHAHGEVKVHGGEDSVQEVHDPYQALLMEGGVEWRQMDIDIRAGNWKEEEERERERERKDTSTLVIANFFKTVKLKGNIMASL